MITETIVLDRSDGSWRSVVYTGGKTVVAGMTGNIKVRFGISSTSSGIEMSEDDTLIAEETFYIRPAYTRGNASNTFVYVNKG